MLRFPLSLVACVTVPALIAAGCAAGSEPATVSNEPAGGSGGSALPDASDDAAPDGDGDGGVAGTGGAGGWPGEAGTGGQPEAGVDAEPDAAQEDAEIDAAGGAGGSAPDAFPCSVDDCYIGGSCIEPGTPQPSDPCQACLPHIDPYGWSSDASNVSCDSNPYWHGVARALPTTPYGRKAAISCHNCYTVSGTSLTSTLTKIHNAQAKGADLIELDIKEHGGVVYVEHDDAGGTSGALLSQVLPDAQLKAGDQLLFIELKETTPTDSFVAQVLAQLRTNGYATAGRPVCLRAFDNRMDNLLLARKFLATPAFATLRPHVRLHVLLSRADGNNVSTLQNKVLDAKNRGMHAVEFEYATPNLFGGLTYASSLGLGTSIYTIPTTVGEVFLATLRDETDSLTTDYPLDLARAVVTDSNGLLYVNTWDQPAAGSSINWFRTNTASYQAAVNTSGSPSTESISSLGQPLFGTTLVFNAAQHIPLYDADNLPNDGYLVSAVVRFDQPVPSDGDTSVLLGKADSASFSLELFNPAGGGDADAVLRFGVHVTDAYRYATYPASNLSTTSSYMITGAYDGDGSVWLWVNNDSGSVTTAGPFTGGVTTNDSLALLGADPQSTGAPRYFFSGKIQMALLQRWANH